jgi:hypothetical protein
MPLTAVEWAAIFSLVFVQLRLGARTGATHLTVEEQTELKDEFAQSRSHEAAKTAYDLCKVIAQSCLLINGGAATAVIALLAKDKVDQVLLTFVPWGLGGYALGVVASAFMLFCVMMMADWWNYYWYYLGYTSQEDEAELAEAQAGKWHIWMYVTFWVAIAAFAVSSGLVAYGMAKSTPTTAVHNAAVKGLR